MTKVSPTFSEAQTRLDDLRDALNDVERQVTFLGGSGLNALSVLYLLDRIDQSLAELEFKGVDVRAERGRFGNLQVELRRHRDLFLTQVGTQLAQARGELQPDRSQWWWFLDAEAASHKSRRRRLWLLAVGVLLLALLSAEYVIGPSSGVRTANRRAQSGKDLATSGDLVGALLEFRAAVEANPDEPGSWVWQGVIHSELGELEQAEVAFEKAVSMYATELEFLVDCGMAYLDVGDLDAAAVSIEQAVIQSPEFAEPYFLRALIAERRGECGTVISDYEKAAVLAHAAGDYELEANARLFLSTAASSCGGIIEPLDLNKP